MQVREVMSPTPEYLSADATVYEAARRMNETGAGAVPVADGDRLVGMLTDRDLAVRVLGEGRGSDIQVREVETEKVLYCYQDDDVLDVLQNMHDQHVQRLVVLNKPNSKDLVGIVSLSDIAGTADDPEINKAVAHCCRRYH